jgi:hypothetical protein
MTEKTLLDDHLLPSLEEKKNLDDYFSSSIEDELPPPLPDEYLDIQQEPHQTWWARGGAVYGMLGLGATGVCAVLFLMTGGGEQKTEMVTAKAAPPPVSNPDAKLKSKLWFKEQNESDGKFIKGKGKPLASKPSSVRPARVVPRSIPSEPIAIAPSRVPVSDGPPKAEFNPPPYSAPAPVAYRAPVQQQSADPNADWQRIQQGATFNVPGVEIQQPQQVAYNQPTDPQAQNVAWNQPGETMAMSSTLGKQIAANTEISATLQAKVPSGGSQKVLLKLNSPLKSNGETVLPKGTLLVASAQPEDDGMSFQITGAYLNDQLVSMPSESIVASASARRGGVGKAAKNFLIGAAGGVVDQMLSGDVTSSISNGTNTTVISNVKKSFVNSALGGVRGGVSTLTSNLQNDSEDQSTGLKKGAKVRIVFTAPTVI